MNWETGESHPLKYFVYGAACSEVEIDCLTGVHRVNTNWESLQVVPLIDLNSIYSICLSTVEAPCIWLRIISLNYQKKNRSSAVALVLWLLPWKTAGNFSYFSGLFKWNWERNHFKEETQLEESFHVDCWYNQQSWPPMWNAIIWHFWRI